MISKGLLTALATFAGLCGFLFAIGVTSPAQEMALLLTLASLLLLGVTPVLCRVLTAKRSGWIAPSTSIVSSLLLVALTFRIVFIWTLGYPAEKAPLVYLVLIVIFLLHGSFPSRFGLHTGNMFRNVLTGILLGSTFYFSVQAGGLVLYYTQTHVWVPFTVRTENLLLTLGFSFAASSFSEELFFRGYLQTVFTRALGGDRALTVSAVLFGLWHLPWAIPAFSYLSEMQALAYGVLYASSTGIAGILYGQMFRYSSSIIPSALAHGLWNTLLTTVTPAFGDATTFPFIFYAINPITYGVVALGLYFIVPKTYLRPQV